LKPFEAFFNEGIGKNMIIFWFPHLGLVLLNSCIYNYWSMKAGENHRAAGRCAEVMGGECLALRARLISRVVSRIYDEALGPHGLKGSQMSILAVIAGLVHADPGEICRLLELDASTLSRNVKRMTTRGWIKRSPKGNRRAHQLELTPEGADVLVQAFPRWQEAQARAAETLGQKNVAGLRKISREMCVGTARG
jgi:DNA-binding MarR family transcriptional regulator